MKIAEDKRKLVQILFGIAVFFLIVNIIIGRIYHSEIPKSKKEISSKTINQNFQSALIDLGFKADWITPIKLRKNKQDSLKYSYLVKVPSDLPIPIVLNEINEQFDSNEVAIRNKELKINGKNKISIYSGSNLKLTADFEYDDQIKRKTVDVGFILTDFNSLSSDEDSVLLKSSEPFAVIIIPSKTSEKLIDILSDNRKEFAVLLNDDISDLDFKLRESFSKNKNELSMRSIIYTYKKAICFFEDEKSDIFKSTVKKIILDELTKRNIKLIPVNSVRKIKGSSDKILESNFNSYMENLEGNKKRLVLISAEDYYKIQSLIIKYRKIGYKFINPSQVIFTESSNY